MSWRVRLSRRGLGALFASLPWFALSRPVRATNPGDRGIGGTGLTPHREDEPRDRGIGGTGVVGTIQDFGSIIVNGLKIAYPKTVDVVIDGRPARVSDLVLGQSVRVSALAGPHGLATHRIAVDSEVIGPIEAVEPGSLTVLKQVVFPPSAGAWQVGEMIAVGGLRRLDGTIVATVIERRPDAVPQIAGVVTPGEDGTPHVGRLRLSGLDPALYGTRCIARGTYDGDELAVAAADSVRALLLAAQPRRLSIEAFVRPSPHGLELGSGLDVKGFDTPSQMEEEYRAVLTVAVTPDGNLNVTHIRPEGGRGGNAGTGQQGPGPRGFGSPPGAGQGGPDGGAGPRSGQGPGSGFSPGSAPGRDGRGPAGPRGGGGP